MSDLARGLTRRVGIDSNASAFTRRPDLTVLATEEKEAGGL